MIRLAIVVGALLELLAARVLPADGIWVYPRLAAALVVLLLPGALIAEALGRRSASATVLWSLGAVFLAWLVTFALDGSVDTALVVLALVAAVALAASLRLRPERPPRILGSAVVTGAGILFGLALWHVAGHVDGDGFFHLARSRKLLELDGLDLASVNEFADGGLHPGYAFPLWHGFVALLARLAAVDPELVVLHAPSVLAPLAFLVAFEAGATLFRSTWLGLAALAAQVGQISLAAGYGGAYASLALPGTASRQLVVPAVLTLVFAHLREPSKALLAAIAAGGLALTLMHPTYSLFLAVPLAGFVLVRALFSSFDALRVGAALAAFGVTTLAALLWLLPYADDTASRNPDSVEQARALRHYGAQLDVLDENRFRLLPEMVSRGGAVAVAALAIVPLAVLAVRRRWAAWVLGGTLPVLALMLVPELFTRLSDAVSISQSRRAAGFVPFAFAFAGGLAVLSAVLRLAVVPVALVAGVLLQLEYPGDFTLRLERGGGPPEVVWWAALAGAVGLVAAAVARRKPIERRDAAAGLAALAFCIPVGVHAAANWEPSPARHPNFLGEGLQDALRELVPEGSVVFSDLETSYRAPAAAPVYVAAGPPAHVADTLDNRPYARRDDVLRFLRTGDLSIPAAYDADFLIVDRRRFRLPRLPPAGNLVYADGRFALYRL